jgi:hypothetical protein
MPFLADDFRAIADELEAKARRAMDTISDEPVRSAGRTFDRPVLAVRTVVFDPGSVEVSPVMRTRIELALYWARVLSAHSIRVEGFAIRGEGSADTWGDLMMSAKRAAAVCTALDTLQSGIRVRTMLVNPTIHILDPDRMPAGSRGMAEILIEGEP